MRLRDSRRETLEGVGGTRPIVRGREREGERAAPADERRRAHAGHSHSLRGRAPRPRPGACAGGSGVGGGGETASEPAGFLLSCPAKFLERRIQRGAWGGGASFFRERGGRGKSPSPQPPATHPDLGSKLGDSSRSALSPAQPALTAGTLGFGAPGGRVRGLGGPELRSNSPDVPALPASHGCPGGNGGRGVPREFLPGAETRVDGVGRNVALPPTPGPPRKIRTRGRGRRRLAVCTPPPTRLPFCGAAAISRGPGWWGWRGRGAVRGPAAGDGRGRRRARPRPLCSSPGVVGAPRALAAAASRRVNGETRPRGVREPGARRQRGVSPVRG